MANLENKTETNTNNVEDILPKIENTSTKNVIVGGAKKSFLSLYKLWIKKYKYPLFAFIAMVTFYLAHQQKSFIEVKKLLKKN